MALKEEFSKELDKLKRMPSKDRLWYLWTYYKIWLAVFWGVVAVISVVATAVYNTSFTTRLAVAVVNNHSQNIQYTEDLNERLRQILDCGKKDRIEVNGGLFLGEEASGENAYLSQTKLAALMTSDALDVMIADEETIALYAEAGSLCDLGKELPEDVKKAAPLSEESAYYLPLDGTWLMEEGYLSQDCRCLAVLEDSPRKEAAFQMIRSLLP